MLQINHLTIVCRADLRSLITDFSLTLNKGDVCALIGEEGNGKSTLLKWIYNPSLVQAYADVSGTCSCSLKKGYLTQIRDPYDGTIYEYLCEEPLFAYASSDEIASVAANVNLPVEMFYSDQRMDTLSGGESIKIRMSRILFSKAQLLLLDEPSNDLDLETLDWLQKFLVSCKDCIILYVSHDEVLLRHTANKIVHLELLKSKQESRVNVAGCGYDAYLQQRALSLHHQDALAISDQKNYARKMEKYQRVRQQVEHDLRNVSRQDPHTGQLLKKKMHSIKAQGKRLDEEKENMHQKVETEEAILFSFPEDTAIPNGRMVLDLHLPLLSIDGNVLAHDVSLQVKGPQHLAIIGRNGCGKTTLMKEIYHQLQSQNALRIGWMPQNYDEVLNEEENAISFLCPSLKKEEVTHVRQMLGAMRYTSLEMERPIKTLSGGQKGKILLLKMQLEHDNVLLLDEPTRNFSPLSAPVIAQTISAFPGAVIMVSHDRSFLESTARQLYTLDQDGLHPTDLAVLAASDD
jgi:ATPase subunit of ABC transporter with duplicated ATPase domains